MVSTVTGKVLAVSADGSRLAVSDPAPLIGGPGRVFIYNQANGGAPVTLPIPNATAAAFSPDGLKTFIISGASLYVYSTVDALKGPLSLSPITNGNGVAFSQYGAFALISGAPPGLNQRSPAPGPFWREAFRRPDFPCHSRRSPTPST